MKPVCILAALFLGFGAFTSGQAQWMKSSLSCDGPITALATQGDTLVVGKQGKEFYRSLDKGVTWTTLSADYFKIGVNCMLIRNEVLFAGTGNGIFLSKDLGNTWTRCLDNNGPTLNIGSFTVQGVKILATTDQGIISSTNNGTTWVSLTDGVLNTQISSILCLGDTIFAAAVGIGVIVSNDRGKSWNSCNDSPDITFLAAKGSMIMAGSVYGSMQISLDQGKSWVPKLNSWSTGWCSGLTSLSSGILENGEDFIVAGTLKNGVFILTEDRNSFWTGANTGLPNTGWNCTFIIQQLIYSETRIFALTNQGLWLRSINDFYSYLHLPVVVDNSKWFPPVRDQQALPDCSQFSVVYYLKSYLWNRHFNRDPKLVENQFSHNFTWNLSVDPVDHFRQYDGAIDVMEHLGCGSMADMEQNEQTCEIFPSLEVQERALRYKSKDLKSVSIGRSADSSYCASALDAVKDSLRQGICFAMGIEIYDHFYNISNENPVYGCDSSINDKTFNNSHFICITGYNDTIKTPEGRGAFRVINSNSNLAGGQWYFDYNWFFLQKKLWQLVYIPG